ncbi:hypothetical protein ACIP97_17970 [Peribacillus frigoritolerans]|uniref:hypothetical protein n=1 Tax=Peribacillus frigoritolerans TaxID=450367 RepID=UPI0038300E49
MNKLSKIDASIIVIALTVISYGIAFTFQNASKKYYHLPSMYTEITIDTMITPLTIIFTILFFILWVGYVSVKIFFSELPSYSLKYKQFSRFLFGLVVICVILGIDKLGETMTAKKEDYMVIRQEEKLFVAVTSYKDSIILAPLDLEKESITPKFKAIEMKELKNAEMIRFENGLKVEDIKNSKDITE